MENNEAGYDFQACDRIWQRVAPPMTPYPTAQQEKQELPGEQDNPCCMGTIAKESLGVLAGFIEGELADRRYYLAFARCAPSCAARLLRGIAAEEGEHARRLQAVYYLITGECFRPMIVCDKICIPPYCIALRERYHSEACGGFNYIRAADATTDPCLTELLTAFSADEYRHANQILHLLECAL